MGRVSRALLLRAIADSIWGAAIIYFVVAVLLLLPADAEYKIPLLFGRTPAQVPYWDLIVDNAATWDIDPLLLAAVVRQESDFNAGATNPHSGAAGLGQLMPITVTDCGISDPYDPDENLWCAARILRQYTDRYGDADLGLAAYNAGPVAVDACRCIPASNINAGTDSSTADYVRLVNGYRDGYQGGLVMAQYITLRLPKLSRLLRLPQPYLAALTPGEDVAGRAAVIPGCTVAPAPVREIHAVSGPYKRARMSQGLHGCLYGHAAIDLVAKGDAALHAPVSGRVSARYIDEVNNTVLVIDGHDYIVTFLHGVYYVGIGDEIRRGEVIGRQASIGRSTGPHTHVTIYDKRAGGNVDPRALLFAP